MVHPVYDTFNVNSTLYIYQQPGVAFVHCGLITLSIGHCFKVVSLPPLLLSPAWDSKYICLKKKKATDEVNSDS